jgi:YVTN family beta-propeller protein
MLMFDRRGIGRLLVGAGAFAAGPARAETAGCGGYVFAADEESRSISVVDLSTGRVSRTAIPLAPHNVDAIPARGLLLAAGVTEERHNGQPARSAGRVVLLQHIAGEGLRVIGEIPAGVHPAHIVPDLTGRHAFMSDSGTDTVLAIDLDAAVIMGDIPVGKGPHGMRLSPDGTELWIANTTAGSVSIVDVSRRRETAQVPVGPKPVQVGFLPDGSRLYVSLAGANQVAEIDCATRQVTRHIPVGPAPAQVFAAPDGRHVFAANQGTRASPGTTVSVIDVARGIVVRTLGTGRGAHGVSICANGSRAFVTNMYEDSLTEIDAERLVVLRRFDVGGSPNGVTWLPG